MNSGTAQRLSRPLAPGTLSALLGAAFLGTGGADPVLSAQSIIVNPVQTGLSVRVWTDRGGAGAGAPSYAPGDRIRLYTSVSQDAYVYLFNVDPRGNVDLILPNRYQGGANFLKANTPKVFPEAGDPFTFNVAEPLGLNKVLALASRTPLNLGEIASFKTARNSFATVNVRGQERLAQALSLVVGPVEQTSWVSGTAAYTVVARTAASRPVPPQPAPVRPAPLPELQGGQASFERRAGAAAVYAGYAARLRGDGYRQVELRRNGGGRHLRGEFRRGGERATLEVRQKGTRFEVKLTRR